MKAMKLFALLLLAASACVAQVQAGRIVGTVTDPNKAVVPNATVAITNTATNQMQTLTSNGAGDFVLTPVNPGVYRVEVSAKGFGTAAINNVEVIVGQSARVDVDLQTRRDLHEDRSHRGTAPLLNTESGTLGQEITNKQIVDLPLNGRSFYELARLTPGATLLPGSGKSAPYPREL